jgi:hypothetical protein
MKSNAQVYGEMISEFQLVEMLHMALEPLLQDCQRQWEQEIKANFDSHGGRVGGWKPLAESTIRLRQSLGYSPTPIMEMRGVLRKGYQVTSVKDGYSVGMDLTWGSNEAGDVFSRNSGGGSLNTWDGKDLAALQHNGGTGFNPITKEGFNVPARPLYNKTNLESIFEKTVEDSLEDVVTVVSMQILGGK